MLLTGRSTALTKTVLGTIYTRISMEPMWYTAVLFKSIMITSTKTGSESIYPPPGRHNLQNYTLLPDLKRKTMDLALL